MDGKVTQLNSASS